MITVTPTDITVTIKDYDRYWVAEALRTTSRELRDQYQGRRAKMTMGKNAHARADRIWALAQQIEP